MTYLCSDENGNATIDGFHCTKIQVRKYANAIKAPVETGQMSFDNKVIMPNEIRLTGYVDAVSGMDAMKTQQILAEMIASRKFKFYSITTDTETYKNLMLIDCPKTIDRDLPDLALYELTFVEVLLVQNKSYTPANPSDKNTTKSGNTDIEIKANPAGRGTMTILRP